MSQLPLELKIAQMLKDEGQYRGAEQHCRQFLTREPGHAEGRYILGTLLLQQQRSEEALMEFQQALSQAPSNGDYWLGFTQALLDLNRPHDAFQTIDDLISKGLDWPAALDLRERAREAFNMASSGRAQAQNASVQLDDASFWTLNLVVDFSFCVPADIQDSVTYIVLEQEDWYDAALNLLEAMIQPGMKVTDISAEYGLFGLRLAQTLDPSSQVRIQLPNDAARTLAQASAERNAIPCPLDLQAGPVTAASQVTDCDLLILSASALSLETFSAEASAPAAKAPLLVLHRLNEQPDPSAWIAVFDQFGRHTYRHLPGLNLLVATRPDDRPTIAANTLFACTAEAAERLRASGMIADWPAEQDPAPASTRTWQQAFSAFPFVASQFGERMLLDAWEDADRSTDKHWPAYQHALNAYLSAQLTDADPTERLAWLLRARDDLETLLQTGDGHLSTLLLRIRVLADTGERNAALKLAQSLVRRLEKGADIELDRPFLPLHARYDYSAPKQDMPTWLLASILEATERLRGSSLWFSADAPPRSFGHLPDAHPQMERCQYLHQYRYSGQLNLPAHSRLYSEKKNEHKNYQWWLNRTAKGASENQYFIFDALDASELIHKAEIKKETLVDIVMPCYNEQDNIREVLDSIKAQEYDNYQIYIVDNHSTDDTLNIIKRHPLYAKITLYKNHLNLGPARSARKGVQLGRSFFTMYASANDLWYPGYLGELIALHNQDPRAALVYAMPDLFERGAFKRSTQPEEFFDTYGKDALSGFLDVWAKVMYGVTHLGLYKKDVIRNLLWPTMYRGGDHVVVAQAALFGHVRFVPKNLVRQNSVPNTNLQSWGFLESTHLRCRDVGELYSMMGWHQFPYLSMLFSCYQAIEQAFLQQEQKDYLIKHVTNIHFQRFGHLIRHELVKLQTAQSKANSFVSLSERKAFYEIVGFVDFIKIFFRLINFSES